MDNTILSKTTLEQMPPELRHDEHPHARKPWAIIITLLVLALFGAYWYTEKNKLPVVVPIEATAPTPTNITDIIDLETALANVTIGGFEDLF